MPEHRVCVHVDERERVPVALANTANLLEDLDDVAVVLVLNSEAVTMLERGSGVAAEVGALDREGVEVLACENSLDAAGIQEDDLLEPVGTVASGVGELARRQADDWAYLRP